MNKYLVLLFTILIPSMDLCAAERSVPFNKGWRFLESDAVAGSDLALDDSDWTLVDLPHDWSVEDKPENPDFVGPFNPKMEGGSHVGWLRGGTGWYRKSFSLNEGNANSTVYLYFDGVMVESELWINGQAVGQHKYGYTPFYFDITPFLKAPGESNQIAVKVINPDNHSRWFTGSGIYRDVSLLILNPVHVQVWGVGVTTPEVGEQMATVAVDVSVVNRTEEPLMAAAEVEIFDPRGRKVVAASKTIELPKNDSRKAQILLQVPNPQLWDVDSPHRYRAVVSLQKGKDLLDRYEQSFGIRTIEFTTDKGFLLNERKLLMKGGCAHHDNGLLGAKAFRDAEFRKVRLLKENGYNAIRSAHNPPSRHFIEACDSLGMLLIDESFDHWVKPKRPNDYHKYYRDWWRKDTEAMVMRSRNSPSVVMWSIGNEVQERADPEGLKLASDAIDLIRSLDPTRPVTLAFNGFWDNPGKQWDDGAPALNQIDVCGYNYQFEQYRSDHEKHPTRIMYGSESMPDRAFENWQLVEALPYVIGDFVWSAFDYLGEATLGKAVYVKDKNMKREDLPFHDPWPHYLGNCGDIGITGDKKAQSHYRDVVWRQSELEMLVHEPVPTGHHELIYYWGWPREYKSWNWPGSEGEPLKVNVYTRYDSVRLELNGVPVGEKAVSSDTITVTFEVPYQPGKLTAVALEGGVEKARQTLSTAGAVAAVDVIPESPLLESGRDSLAYVKVAAIDVDGHLVPDGDTGLRLDVEGPAELLAAGNAHYIADGSFQDGDFRLHKGLGQIILRSTGEPGTVFISVVGNTSVESSEIKGRARIEFK